MIAWLMSKTGLYVVSGAMALAVVGGVYWKVTSYIDAHEELEAAYERQQLELNQAIEVNRNNEVELARIQSDHQTTLDQLHGQLTSEIGTSQQLEFRLSRLQELADQPPEIRYVTEAGETCPDPITVVSPVLADPFGVSNPTD